MGVRRNRSLGRKRRRRQPLEAGPASGTHGPSIGLCSIARHAKKGGPNAAGQIKTLVGSLARHAASTAFVSAMNSAVRSCSDAGTCTRTSSLPLAWRGVGAGWGAEAGSDMTSREQLNGEREQTARQNDAGSGGRRCRRCSAYTQVRARAPYGSW